MTFHSWSTKLRGFWLSPFIGRHSLSEVKNGPHSRQEKPIDKTLCTCYNTWELTEKFPISYRGVEQLEARRAHNPEVVGSSPASATKIMGLLQNFFLQQPYCFTLSILFRGQDCRLQPQFFLGHRKADRGIFPGLPVDNFLYSTTTKLFSQNNGFPACFFAASSTAF